MIECKICNLKFSTYRGLSTHLRNIHIWYKYTDFGVKRNLKNGA
jgi:hypothetical protein